MNAGVPQIFAARAHDLAIHALQYEFVRRDVHGGYNPIHKRGVEYTRSDGKTAEIGTVTTKHKRLTFAKIKSHFAVGVANASLSPEKRLDLAPSFVIGAHLISERGQSRKMVQDTDAHGQNADPVANKFASLCMWELLTSLGFTPLLWDSDGKGGYHNDTFFSELIPSHLAHAFSAWITSKHLQFGINTPPDTFPVQARNSPDHPYGSWCRIFGRHHTRDVWPTVWNGREWVEGNAAIDYKLSLRGNSPSLIPQEVREIAAAEEAEHNAGVERAATIASRVSVPVGGSVATSQATSRSGGKDYPWLDVEAWLRDRSCSLHEIKVESGGRKVYCLDHCPFNAEHTNGDACITQAADGTLGARCCHNSCRAYNWQDFKEQIGKPSGEYYHGGSVRFDDEFADLENIKFVIEKIEKKVAKQEAATSAVGTVISRVIGLMGAVATATIETIDSFVASCLPSLETGATEDAARGERAARAVQLAVERQLAAQDYIFANICIAPPPLDAATEAHKCSLDDACTYFALTEDERREDRRRRSAHLPKSQRCGFTRILGDAASGQGVIGEMRCRCNNCLRCEKINQELWRERFVCGWAATPALPATKSKKAQKARPAHPGLPKLTAIYVWRGPQKEANTKKSWIRDRKGNYATIIQDCGEVVLLSDVPVPGSAIIKEDCRFKMPADANLGPSLIELEIAAVIHSAIDGIPVGSKRPINTSRNWSVGRLKPSGMVCYGTTSATVEMCRDIAAECGCRVNCSSHTPALSHGYWRGMRFELPLRQRSDECLRNFADWCSIETAPPDGDLRRNFEWWYESKTDVEADVETATSTFSTNQYKEVEKVEVPEVCEVFDPELASHLAKATQWP